MPSPPKGNALIMQSGGPTAVVNQSLAGVVQDAMEHPAFGELYGAVHGLEGLLKGQIRDLRHQPTGAWRRIASTPGAALGSARRKLQPDEMSQVMQTLQGRGVTYLFAIGGNDSAETAHKLAQASRSSGQPLTVVAVPKTVDNDLPETDHCPGYGSAARFVALATMGAGRDAESMGQASPITILEVMGRNAGWLAAASALGKRDERDAPHLICLPESAFDEDRFMGRMEVAHRRWGYALAVVSENLREASGPVGHQGDPLHVDDFGHPYYPSPGQYLAGELGRRLGLRVRFEKPGTIQRSVVVSRVDAGEAFTVGRMAVRYALEGHTDVMVALLREPGNEYRCVTGLAPLEAVAGRERPMPPEYIDEPSGLVTQRFLDYARPLIDPPLPRFERLS